MPIHLSTTSHLWSLQCARNDAKITIQLDRHNGVELRDSQNLKLRLRGATHSGKIMETAPLALGAIRFVRRYM